MNMTEEYLVFGLCILMGVGVCGDSDEVKSVSVMEGHSVTLHTNLTDIQTNDLVLWRFEESRIARIFVHNSSIYDDTDGRFRDKLQLDSQTGSLTITNISITNSGLYKLKIISDRGNSYKTFNVTVYARLSVPVISRNSSQCSSSSERSSSSSCVLLCSVMNVSHVTLSWYNGSDLHSSISVSDLNIRLSLPLEVEYQDTNTYSCVLNNPITNHTTHLNITDVCQPCSELNTALPVCISVGLIVFFAGVAAVAVACCYWWKWKKANQGDPQQQGNFMTERWYNRTKHDSAVMITASNSFVPHGETPPEKPAEHEASGEDTSDNRPNSDRHLQLHALQSIQRVRQSLAHDMR